MKLLEKINWEVLDTYIENGLIMSNKHPEYDIWILNYTPKTQSKKLWDVYTISCRGLIIDVDGNILARPFQKFKNFEEHDSSEIDMSLPFEIFEKRDGSLIILFYYELRMEWIVASRGSFASEQSIEAKKILESKENAFKFLDIKNTYLYEVHYGENRIVVDYGDLRDVVLLTVINSKTGYELSYDAMNEQYSNYFAIVKRFDININSLDDLKKLEEENKEGFVVKFSNNFRVKVKFSEYIRLHGILTNVSNIIVWEHLKNNYDFDTLLDRVPDEFYSWLNKTIDKLKGNFNEIERLSLKEFIRIYYINEISTRREFAMEAKKCKYRSILFKLYDKNQYDEIIWKMIRPVYSKPFSRHFENSLEIN